MHWRLQEQGHSGIQREISLRHTPSGRLEEVTKSGMAAGAGAGREQEQGQRQ